MVIKKITITFSTAPKPRRSKPKLETFMLNVIEKLLKHFVRLWEVTLGSDLPSRDKAELLRFVIFALALLCAFYLGTR